MNTQETIATLGAVASFVNRKPLTVARNVVGHAVLHALMREKMPTFRLDVARQRSGRAS